MAAQENRVEIVTYLLENGAKANLATEVLLLVVRSCCLVQIFPFFVYIHLESKKTRH